MDTIELTNRMIAEAAGWIVDSYLSSDIYTLYNPQGKTVADSYREQNEKDELWDYAPDFLHSTDAALGLVGNHLLLRLRTDPTVIDRWIAEITAPDVHVNWDDWDKVAHASADTPALAIVKAFLTWRQT